MGLSNCFVPTTDRKSARKVESLLAKQKAEEIIHTSPADALAKELDVRLGWCCQESVLGSAYVRQHQSTVVAYAMTPRPDVSANGSAVSFTKGVLRVSVNYAQHLAGASQQVFDPIFRTGDIPPMGGGSTGEFRIAGAPSGEARDMLEQMSLVMAEAICTAISPAIRLAVYPKTALTVSVLLLSSGFHDLCTAINATALALAHAGVDMRDIVTASTVVVPSKAAANSTNANGEEIVTTGEGAAEGKNSMVTVASLPNTESLTLVDVTGQFEPALLAAYISAATEFNLKMRGYFDTALQIYAESLM